MLASAVAVGLLIGLALKGDLGRLARVRIRIWPLFLTALVLRVLAVMPLGDTGQHVVYTVSLWALLTVVVANLSLPGGALSALGVASNAISVSLFGGAMPVFEGAVATAGVHPPVDALHTLTPAPALLGDVIPIPAVGVYSVGDVLLAVGVVLFIASTMRGSS